MIRTVHHEEATTLAAVGRRTILDVVSRPRIVTMEIVGGGTRCWVGNERVYADAVHEALVNDKLEAQERVPFLSDGRLGAMSYDDLTDREEQDFLVRDMSCRKSAHISRASKDGRRLGGPRRRSPFGTDVTDLGPHPKFGPYNGRKIRAKDIDRTGFVSVEDSRLSLVIEGLQNERRIKYTLNRLDQTIERLEGRTSKPAFKILFSSMRYSIKMAQAA